MRKIKKNPYIKPKSTKINVDNSVSIHMISEGTIPDNPPWAMKNTGTPENPFKINNA